MCYSCHHLYPSQDLMVACPCHATKLLLLVENANAMPALCVPWSKFNLESYITFSSFCCIHTHSQWRNFTKLFTEDLIEKNTGGSEWRLGMINDGGWQVTVAYNKDSSPLKVNLGVGAYRTEVWYPLFVCSQQNFFNFQICFLVWIFEFHGCLQGTSGMHEECHSQKWYDGNSIILVCMMTWSRVCIPYNIVLLTYFVFEMHLMYCHIEKLEHCEGCCRPSGRQTTCSWRCAPRWTTTACRQVNSLWYLIFYVFSRSQFRSSSFLMRACGVWLLVQPLVPGRSIGLFAFISNFLSWNIANSKMEIYCLRICAAKVCSRVRVIAEMEDGRSDIGLLSSS